MGKGHRIRLTDTLEGTCPTSPHHRTDLNPLFDYTSGRWLWNEREQLEARHRWFDVPGLQQAACQAIGTNKCTSLKKIGEGNLNKAYRLEMEDGQKVIAKIPHPNAGPTVLTTSSEVATMEFARDILNLPVPKVLAWSATDQNPVQAEYIIMEEAQGSQLHKVWQDLPLRKKVNIMREFVEIEKKLLSISFDKFGSLYFRDSGIQGCEPAIVKNASQGSINHISSRYCIGPITRREFWKGQRSQMEYHGPYPQADGGVRRLDLGGWPLPPEECLIRVKREWAHFKAKRSCPYHFSTDQIRQHDEEAEIFNKSQEFWRSLQGVLTDEGYASHESFNKAVEILNELRAAGLRDLKGEERIKFDEETVWIASLHDS
ncbi:hypothetical protein SVAN01_10698 [Stagonosporopsis vannaccii]|nr:hypothetical protein SVAN01_10698 [Stagonosporopsis vannaccii]